MALLDCFFFVVDTTPPQCTNLPADITRFVELGLPGDDSVTWVEPTCEDASGTGRVLVSTFTPPASFAVGTTTVTYTCTDDASLTTSCSFEVNVQTRDTVPPVIANCPDNQVLTVELGTESMRAFWAVPTATDVSGVATIESNTHNPGDLFNVGMTTVMYVFVDSSQNRATCQFTITVETGRTQHHRRLVIAQESLLIPLN
ncbi:Hyalin [Holothuria leucospilota]|uniref:Hyalin n=1 Tax=Holothuria leucospilota TaxID=206669 RepID=A0A9Q1H2F0_HOLLE|nr:Hyalin [Holothuria leucospilota]